MSFFDRFRRKLPLDPIAIWRRIIVGDHKSWVLFRNGTCVIFTQPQRDLRANGIQLLTKWGPVHAGGPAGDFSVVNLTGHPGWIVTCHHHDILTYVAPNEVAQKDKTDIAIGLLGRGKRDRDAVELDVIHVEENQKHA